MTREEIIARHGLYAEVPTFVEGWNARLRGKLRNPYVPEDQGLFMPESLLAQGWRRGAEAARQWQEANP
jgi:hypothetical protein